MSNLFASALSTSYRFELPGAKPQYKPDRPGQVEHIALDLAINIPQKTFGGTCQIRLKPIQDGLERLVLDAVDLQIQHVDRAGNSQSFEYDGQQLTVALSEPTVAGQALTLTIHYQVTQPRRGLYFVAPTPDEPDKPVQVWTQGEDEDSRFWFPCFDYPGQLATSEIRVRIPQDFVAISNGELVQTEVLTETAEKIYHWSQQEVHPTYLMTLAIGKFAEVQDSLQGLPVTYYVEPDRLDQVDRTMGKTPQMIEFFSQFFGYPYPFPKYAQVCVDDFIFGGMENTSTTLLTSRCLLDERAALDHVSSESLVAHELAHQWFGDLIVIDHWAHAWIKEGMASYAEVLWFEREYGTDEGAYYLLGEARSYLSEDSDRYRRPIVTHVYREAIELYDSHIYEKGACVYHMMRAELGEVLFKKAIAQFVGDHAHSTVETVDLIRAIEKATGRNLRFLFDQYVYRGGHPDYEVTYAWDGDSQLAQLTIKQTQAKAGTTLDDRHLFDLKLPISFGFVSVSQDADSSNSQAILDTINSQAIDDQALAKLPNSSPQNLSQASQQIKQQTFKVRVYEAEQSFYFSLSEKPSFVSFDAGNHTLKTVSLKYPLAELKAQLQFDPDPISRLYAAQALAKKGGREAVQALGQALVADPFWGVRAEVATALATLQTQSAFTALQAGLADAKAQVRSATVAGLSRYATIAAYDLLDRVLAQGDPSYKVEAAAATGIGTIAATYLETSPATIPATTPLTTQTITTLTHILETRLGWNEVVGQGAIAGLSKLKTSEAALDVILRYTQPGTPQALRRKAISALGAISAGQMSANLDRILDRLAQLAHDEFFLIQVSVVAGLGQMTTPKAIGILQALAARTADGRVVRLADEAVRVVQDQCGSDRALHQLRDELDAVKQRNHELLSRIEELEAKTKN